MPRQTIFRELAAGHYSKLPRLMAVGVLGPIVLLIAVERIVAQQPLRSGNNQSASSQPSADQQASRQEDSSGERQADLEAALVKMLSGATLEGSFTSTGAGGDPTKLSREKYTLGNVKKLAGKFWLIPARIQYGEHDVTLPITVPVEWAGDTPMIVVDNVTLPGFGTVSARVMFFADHYAGYWKHGHHGGHLFGVIRRDEPSAAPNSAQIDGGPSVDKSPPAQEPEDQSGQRQAVDNEN